MEVDIEKRLKNIKNRIKKAIEKSAQPEKEVKLLTVIKKQPMEKIEKALSLGVEYIAENRVQEAEKKIPKLKNKYKEFHFIGHLQSNKINKLLKIKPVLIHSIDKYSTAKKLNKRLIRKDLDQDILIQVNTSFEESKYGTEPEETEQLTKEISKLERVHIKGLMTIGKLTDNEDEIRRGFKKLKQLFDQLKEKDYENMEMKYLSMGMTSDFEIAIEEGSNIVRIGRAILGERKY